MKAYFRGAALAGALSLLTPAFAAALAWNETDRTLPAPDRQAYLAAAGALKSRLEKGTTPPTLPDPLVRNFQDQALALSRVLGGPTLPTTEVSDFFAICQPAADIFVDYMVLSDSDIPRYRDEALPAWMFALHCMAQFVPAIQARLATGAVALTPTQVDGGRTMRGGLFKILASISELIPSGEMGPDYPERFVDLLAQDAEPLAALLTLDQRAQLLAKYKVLARIAPTDQKARYDRWLAALASTDCQGFCAA